MKKRLKKLKKYLEGKLIVVKVGDADRPALQSDLDDVEKQLKKAFKGSKCIMVVTHHCIEFEVIN